MYPESIKKLIEELRKLPGIGDRTAERLAFFISRRGKSYAFELARAIQEVGDRIRTCSICFNTSETDPCPIC
ncbi:MAG: recombination protein RecR, partial [Planctomycetota bacterium]